MEMTFTKSCDLLQLSKTINQITDTLQIIKDNDDGTMTAHFSETLDTATQQNVTDAVNNHTDSTIGVPIVEVLSSSQGVKFTEIDYTLITPKLHPKRTFDKGELQLVEWYLEHTFDTLVIKVEIEYFRDAYDFPEYRVTTRTWYNTDGTENPEKTIRTKYYDSINKHAEIRTRRNNNILQIQDTVITYMVATMGIPAADAIQQGKDYMASVDAEVNKYVKTGASDLSTAITNNTTETWLDNTIPSTSITIRDYILMELA